MKRSIRRRRRYGRSEGSGGAAGMTADQRAVAEAALAHYGARLTDGGFIARGEKVTGVRLDVRKGRLRALAGESGNLLASYPASRIATGVADFVTSFWFWEPATRA